ncbi:hypothetical protein D0A36_05860 [Xanthomonas campestris]|nr:hypothetical protein D0A41_07385 [Xanthomonas campestris]RFF59929.1 hypothetical protein D0A36_05860 [Xanthomonas campestris]
MRGRAHPAAAWKRTMLLTLHSIRVGPSGPFLDTATGGVHRSACAVAHGQLLRPGLAPQVASTCR